MEKSLNDLHLSNSMVAALYGHSLVQLDAAEKSTVSKKASGGNSFKFLGSNLKNVTILVNNPGHTFLPEDELAMLTKLLAACQMNTGDVAIVNMAGGKTSLPEIFIQLKPAKIISFGKMENTQLFTIEKRNGADLLAAPELKEMTPETSESRQLKSTLWGELKKMFGV